MSTSIYLVFGDLHGRILPAFRLATLWVRDHGLQLDGLLQVGDLGYFPDPTRLDKATRRFAAEDPTELGALEIVERSRDADRVFEEEGSAPGMWFTAGNHEDYHALKRLVSGDSFAVDAYQRVWCIRDGRVATPPGGLRVGAMWGIDPRTRRNVPEDYYLKPESATRLACSSFDVLLSHDCAKGAVYPDSGSDELRDVLRTASPAFAFFGHYHGVGRRLADVGRTQVYHLNGMELHGPGGCADEGSVGVLTWRDGAGTFEYVPFAWLRRFTRYNWRHF